MTVRVHSAADRTLVTAIEVLSATDKTDEGRGAYLAKRRHLLRGPAHLVEVDLLRTGDRTVARPLPPADYLVTVYRADRQLQAEVWPIPIRSPLPSVPVPLRPGDCDAPLNLQAVLTAMYDAFGYDLDLDYSRPPDVPIAPADAAWAAELLRARKH